MNKKIIAVMLVMIMVVCNSMVVWADTTNTTWNGTTYGGEGDSKDATASWNITEDSSTSTGSFCVEITWGDLGYTITGKGTWDTENTCYKIENAKCSPTVPGTSDKITVVNKSNKQITATLGWKDDDTAGTENFKTKYGCSSTSMIATETTEDSDTTDKKEIQLLDATSGVAQLGTRYIDVNAPITKAPSLTASSVKVGSVTVTITTS